MAKRKYKALVERAKYASGNKKYALDRMPKGHWMRKDQAKRVRKSRNESRNLGKGIKPHG